MDTSQVGIAKMMVAMQAGSLQQSVEMAVLKQQGKASEAVVRLLETANEAARSAAPLPGQGRQVDIRA